MASGKNIWPTIVKHSFVIVLDKIGKCILHSQSDLFMIL